MSKDNVTDVVCRKREYRTALRALLEKMSRFEKEDPEFTGSDGDVIRHGLGNELSALNEAAEAAGQVLMLQVEFSKYKAMPA